MEIIFTKHALLRMRQRLIKKEDVEMTISRADTVQKASNGTVFVKNIVNRRFEVVTKKGDKGEVVVVSTWVDPPFEGSSDFYKKIRYKKYKNTSFWGKIWMWVLRLIFKLDW